MSQITANFSSFIEKCSDNQHGVNCYREWYNGQGYVLRTNYRGCENSAILFPGFELLPHGLLAVIYGAFLVYLFFGVNLATEYFMRGVEQIAYSGFTKTIRDPDTGEDVQVRVTYWNEQVSTLTLIAAGSSAPEIFLATIGAILTLGKPPDELGPGTILGTAAYNSLIITAAVLFFCPKGKPKKILELGAYSWTSLVAIWTYIWLMLVYKFISPNQIELWEAVVTLIQQPILVLGAFWIDRQPWRLTADQYYLRNYKRLNAAALNIVKMEVFNSQGQTFVADKAKLAVMMREAKERDPNFQEEAFVEEFLEKISKGDRVMARLKSRITARQAIAGGFEMRKGLSTAEYLTPIRVAVHPGPDLESLKQYIGFARKTYSVLESAGSVKLAVKRSSSVLAGTASVSYYTKDGTAEAGTDYVSALGTLFFGPGESVQYITVEIIDDRITEPDKVFSVHLVSPLPLGDVAFSQREASVTIIDNDDPGIIGFTLMDVEATNLDSYVHIEVSRRAGASGEVSVDYYTTDSRAQSGRDYDGATGQLVLEHGEVSKTIKIKLHSSMSPGIAFFVDLVNPSNGAKLGISRCRVHVDEHPAVSAAAKKLVRGMMIVRERLSDSAADYATQFRDALTPGGGSEEDSKQVSWLSLCLHYICSTIKIIIACLPPPTWGRGYPCLFCGLAIIGCFTYLLGEAASLFGCSIGFDDYLTAVVFVAAGTSLPDTVASVIAIRDLPTADAALGNITGSNAVNVFIGLGLPWIIASGYYTYKGEPYVTPAKSLAFCVVMFNIVNFVAVVMISLQRYFTGYEVHDGFVSKKVFPLVFLSLLLLFLALVGAEDKGQINGF